MSPPPPTLSFVEDDYARALAEARARNLPLFVDAWAPWCHTCLSMRSYVFPDPALAPFAGRFVWLAVDTERPENAALVSRLGVKVLPTSFVIEPATERPVLAWPGSLTAAELGSLLEDAAIAAAHGGTTGQAGASLLRARQASADGRSEEAIGEYRAALAAAPAVWSRRPATVDGLVTELAMARHYAACVREGAAAAPAMPAGSPLADVLRAAIGCAEELPKDDPGRAALPALVALGERVAADPAQPILADDRSDLYATLVDGLRELGRRSEVEHLARDWATMLETEASRAATPAARAVFDTHRLLAYLAMNEPLRAIPMLAQSERDFPQDYNPPARLATAYLAARRTEEALAAIHRALALAYGPRKLRLFSVEADIHEARGDRAAARHVLREALTYANGVSLTGSYPKLRDALGARLEKMGAR